MKKLYLIAALCLFSLAASAQEDEAKERRRQKDEPEGQSQITFVDTEHNFGRIHEQGKKVTHDFVFTNTGDCPLVITRAVSSCRCVSASYTRKPIPPGGQGMVSVTYDPKKQFGVFRKAIQVFSNAPEGMHIVITKGEVITDPLAGFMK